MLKALIDFLLNRKGHPTQHDTTTLADAPVAPYKVEAVKCGCGRSPTGNCVGHHKLTDTEWAAHPDNKNVAKVQVDNNWPFPAPVGTAEEKPAKAKSTRTKKAPAAAMTAAEKPATAKKPAKPRAKKAPKA